MIKTAKLRKLIKTGATIYAKWWNVPITLSSSFKIIKLKDSPYKNCEYVNSRATEDELYSRKTGRISIKDLYETEDELTFLTEYKNIQRTEYLDLPTWEEVKSNKRHNLAIFYRNHNEIQFYIKNNIYIVRFGFDGDINFIFKDEKTKENYLEACKICKKLFLGEGKNE